MRLDFVCGRVADLAGHLLGPAQDVQAAIPARALADRLLEALHGLEVVVEDVRPGVHDRPQPVVRAVEVGDQDLDAHPGRGLAHLRGSSRRRSASRRRAGRRGRRSSRRRAPGPSPPTASATRRGSSSSNQVGRPVFTAQNPQARVQVSPRIMIVAVRWSQHSPMFGQWASSQTVLRQAAHQALEVVVVLAGRQPGLDPVGVATRRSGRRPTGRAPRPSRSSVGSPARGRAPRPAGSNIGSSRAIGRV